MKTRLRPWIRLRTSTFHRSGLALPMMIACALGGAALIITGGGLVALGAHDSAPSSSTMAPSSAHSSFTPLLEVAGTDIVRRNTVAITQSTPADETGANPGNDSSSTTAATATTSIIAETPINTDASMIRYFNGRPIRPVRTITMLVTAYSPDARSCAPSDDGITASGFSVETNGGYMIAADRKFKFGTLMSVPGYNGNRPTPVLDRGGAIKGNHLDVLYPTHEIARQWGRQTLDVVIWQYADGNASLGVRGN